jgi:hypothetical protein
MLLGLAVSSVGCGDVLFVPSPFTPQNVDLVYSRQEDISIVRWRIDSTEPMGSDLKFQFLGDNGWEDIDFSKSVYPGGQTACLDKKGSCFQYVVRGHYPTALRSRPIQAVHATYGTLPGSLVTPQAMDQTLSVVSFFHVNNVQVTVNITDAVEFTDVYYFPRTYNRVMWPTNGLCVSDSPPANVSFSPLDPTQTFPPDLPLSGSGIYCVGVSPIPNDGAACVDGSPPPCPTWMPALAQTRTATLPNVTEMHQTFMPPVEVSPVIYQIVLDLQIEATDRCDSSRMKIENLVDKYMGMSGGAQVVKIATKNIAMNPDPTGAPSNCAQADAALPSVDMADAVLQTVTSFPQTHQQFHFLFFNNLDAALPSMSPLLQSLSTFFSDVQMAPSPYQLELRNWLFNPGLFAATGPTWWMSPLTEPWLDADDPNFEQMLATYVQANLPFKSQVWDSSVPIPLLSASDAAALDGDFFKICRAVPNVRPVYTSPVVPLSGYAWPIMAANPPGYTLDLYPQIDVPGPSFLPTTVSVDFQICSAYCDHPYVSTGGTGVDSWQASPLCAETP